MKTIKTILVAITLMVASSLFAQVGIGTTTPDVSSKLDVTATDKGFLTPRMTAAQRVNIPSPAAGLLVYQIDGTIGFYYYNGVSWIIIAAEPFGDVKSNFQNTNHNGWVRLDGRLKTTLSSTQRAQADLLGIGTNLPDATDSYLVQKSGASSVISGSNTVTPAQTNLPNVNFTGTSGNAGSHNHTVAPRQRNSREENKQIKAGKGDDLWNDKPNKKKHKDIDARWTKKNGETFYGYKNHAKVGTKSKFINTYTVTDAAVHDSQALDDLLTEKDKDQDLHADSAYIGEEQDKTIAKYEMKNKVHEKGYRNKPLTEQQKASNTKKSKIRARVEHVFGFMEQSMNGLVLKSVGITRASGIIGLINLTYNLFRYQQTIRLKITY